MNLVLAESAPLARRWGQETCWHDPVNGKSCAWYHGAWQTLRLLGIVSTLTHHADLYIEALTSLINKENSNRVFLSGSADYGLLSVILEAYSKAGVEPDITVVDRCTTPLRLCRWYAERFGYAINVVESDLVGFRDPEPYDLICVHSLLSCVPVHFHAGVVATWHSLLRPGGSLLMANTIYPKIDEAKAVFSPEDIATFRARVAVAVDKCPHPDALPPSHQLDAMAEAFASAMEANVISSRKQLTDLLTEGGFDLLETRFGKLIADPNHQRTGPPRIKEKEHAWIVAQRV